MAYTRDGVLSGQAVTLRVVFEDDSGTLVDPDAVPDVYIYDESFTSDDIEEEIDAAVYTGAGPYVPTRISTGYYEYTYTVPSGSNEGTWRDLWVSEQDGVSSAEWFEFEVVVGNTVSLQKFVNNTLVVIELDSSIANLDGSLTLGEDIQLAFSVTYSPLYASAVLVRAEVGPWIDFIPDDTLNLLIHWSSKEADAITPNGFRKLYSGGSGDEVYFSNQSKGRNNTMYKFARTKFVIYDTACKALLLPGAANSGNVSGSGGSKQLGDLKITTGLGGLGGMGLTMEMIKDLRKMRDEWARVVNAGGNIMPGQSLDPSIAVKGLADPDRKAIGRLWDENWTGQPTQNQRVRRIGRRRHKHVFGDR